MDRLVITCVKLGNKYPSEMVNNLYKMCCKHITQDFDFFCYTDDPSNIIPTVNIINYVNHNLDIIVYNKLFLFSDWMDKQLPPGPRVFFDLDLVIKDNIDDVVQCNKGHLSLIYAAWREEHAHGFPMFHHPFNSSCMTWRAPHTRSLWEHFSKDPEMFMNKYYWGMDSFMFYEKEKAGVKVEYFPYKKFYSHMFGVDFAENGLYDPNNAYKPSKFVEAIKTIPVVLLNGPTTPDDYKRQYNKYYGV